LNAPRGEDIDYLVIGNSLGDGLQHRAQSLEGDDTIADAHLRL
jgi:hypothetical protein